MSRDRLVLGNPVWHEEDAPDEEIDRPRHVPVLGRARREGESRVDEELAKVVWVARARVEAVVDQPGLEPHRVKFLGVRDVEEEEADDPQAEGHAGDLGARHARRGGEQGGCNPKECHQQEEGEEGRDRSGRLP